MIAELTITGADVAAKYAEAIGKKLPIVIVRALNRAIRSARVVARRNIVAETGLRAKYVTRSLSIVDATRETQRAALIATEKSIPLVAYVGLKGFRSGKGIAGQSYRLGLVPAGAFFAEMPKTGHRGIFRRKGRAQTPIESLQGPALPGVIVQKRIFEALKGPATETFHKRIQHEAERLIATGEADAP